MGTALLALPLSQQPGADVSFLDCLFTAVSAVCAESINIIAFLRDGKVMAILDPSTEVLEQDVLIVLKQRS